MQGANSTSRLASLNLTYPGWKDDIQIVEDRLEQMERPPSRLAFSKLLHKLVEKQRIHDGDRSHPRIVELDSLQLSYIGWEQDIKDAEQAHYDNYFSPATKDVYFKSKLNGLRNRQHFFELQGAQKSTEKKKTENMVQDSYCPFCVSTKGNQRTAQITQLLGLCIICGEQPKSHVMDPCGHFCACADCVLKILRTSRTCPICRCQVTKGIRVFFS